MFKKIFIIAMAVFFYAGVAPEASVIDAPHDINSGVTCGACHSYSLWWRYAPTNQSISPGKNKIDNEVCNNCHDGSKAQIPAQSAHSSAIIIPPNHGTWESACVDCHDPHFQGQLDWVDPAAHTYPAGLYLVKGTIGAVAAGAVANTTNLGYVPDANLTGNWADRSRWGQKNANPDFNRGLIMVVDIDNDKNSTYQVVAADNMVITVKGTVEPVDAGKSFGLIYGQMIRQVISTPLPEERPVRFFDPNTLYAEGGFTDQRTPRQGLCQVCHTKTTHWTQNALLDGHNANQKCTNCHDAAQGFKPALPAHGFLVNTSPCTNCHQHQASDPLAMHGNSCFTCHSTPPLLRTDAGNFGHVTRIGRDPAGIPLGDGKTATACTYCHTAYFGGHTHNHASSVAANPALTPVTANCQGCHPASVSPFVGVGEAHAVSGCATCHDLTGNGALQGAAANATAPYGECIRCHVGYFTNHEHGASGGSRSHAVSLGADSYGGESCATCHNSSNGGLLTWNDILVEHQGNCGFCHNASRTPNVRPPYTSVADVILQADAQHPVTCLDCHASHTNDHQGRYVSAYEDADQPTPVVLTTCAASCHSATFAVNATNPKLHRTCQSCHAATATPVTLQGSAIGKTVPEANPFNNCYTCHGADYFSRHANVNHSGQGVVTATSDNTCERCHTRDTITSASIHNDKCYLCHDLDRGGVLISLAASGAGNCQACHGNNWLTIHATMASVDHSTTVAMATDCSGCHAGAAGLASGITVSATDHKKHYSCSSCHDTSGALAGIAAGQGGGADCNSCHGPFASRHGGVTHAAKVSLSPACANCHAGTAGTPSGMPTSGVDNSKHDDCSQCHGLDGVLVGAAAGHGATNACADCHAVASQHPALHFVQINETTDRGLSTNQACNACHGQDGTDAGLVALDTWTEILALHGAGNCAVCHGTNREVVDNLGQSQAPVTTVADVIAASANPTTCLACHLDKQQPAEHGFDHLAGGMVAALARCVTCHPNPNLLTGIHAANGCTTCHDKTTAPVTLKGSAVGHGKAEVLSAGVPNTCGTCHSTRAANFLSHALPDHVARSFVLPTTNGTCDNCHNEADTINGGTMHRGACANCHIASPGGATDGTLTGSAAGQFAGGNCTTCHVNTWLLIHQGATPAIGHLLPVGMAMECSSCHAGADGTAAGMPVDGLDPRKHQACLSCHDGNGELISKAAGNLGPNTCCDCHGSFSGQHALTDHTEFVAMALDCFGCHSAVGNTVDPNNPMVHDSCAQCHGTNGSLIGSGAGHSGGGSCNVCHGSFATRHATKDHSLLVSLSTDCAGCHAGSQGAPSGMPVGGSAKQHGSCASCHGTTGALVSIAIGKGGGAECNSCHGTFAVKHSTTNHAFRVALATNCADCHTGTEGSVTGIPISSTDHKLHDACSQCHGASGTLIGSAAGKEGATSTTPNDCSVCHGPFVNNHATVNHNPMVSMNGDCAACHATSGNTVIPDDPKTHHACASCHGVDGRLVGAAAGRDGATIGGLDGGGNCSTCHGGFVTNHANVDHASRVSMATDCSACHTATANTVNPNDPKVHDACATCHNANGSLAGSAAGHPGGGSCNVCHDSFASIHATRDHSSLASLSTDCAGCHTGSQGTVTGMPVGGSNKQHGACASCHGSTGALVSIAVGKGGGAECDTCHGVFAVTHQNADHSFRVSAGTNCLDCHAGTAGNGSGIPLSLTDHKVHEACSQCHGTTGTLIGLAAGKEGASSGAPNDCATCHGGFAANHAAINHETMVSMAAHCSGCHIATGNTVNQTDPRVHDDCTSCHGLDGRLIKQAAGHFGSSIGGTDGGGECTVCHGEYLPNHQSVEHNFRSLSFGGELICSECHTSDPGHLGFVGGGTLLTQDDVNALHSRSTGDGCALCHYYNEATQANAEGLPLGSTVKSAIVNGTNASADATCVVCHGYNQAQANHNTEHTYRVALDPNCADCHPGTAGGVTGIPLSSTDNKVHDACGQCHGTTGVLTGSAAGKEGASSGTPNNCATCHGGFVNNHANVNHTLRVSMSTECSGCHTATGNTVNPDDPKVHAACASCHAANGSLTGAAANHAGGGQCTLCHGGFTTIHANANHSFRVALSTDCADCHSGTEGAGNGMAVNAADPKKHSGCAECHGTTGALIGLATGQLGATIAAPNTCNTCHGLFVDNHAEVNHGSMVKMASNEHCSGCHTAAGNTVDPNDPRVHDACTSCHGADGRLINLAAGHNGGSNGGSDGGGDCIICHGEYLPNHQSVDAASSNHNQRSITYDGGLNCTFCHSSDTGTVGVAGTGELLTMNDVDSLHSRPTADPCSLCHYYNVATQANPQGLPLWNQVRDAIVNGTNGTADATCVICHDYNQTDTGHWYHGTNQAPHFSPTTFAKPEASLNTAYVGETIAGSAVDPESDAITYSKVSGPAWLTVATDGTLGGTPTMAGMDSFVVEATATGGIGYATLTVTVVTPGN